MMVANAVPEHAAQAAAIYDAMDFGFYYDPAEGQPRRPWTERREARATTPSGSRATTTAAEHRAGSRATSRSRGARFRRPTTSTVRTFPDTCDWNWQEMQPHGVNRTYEGVDVFEGHYTYAG